MSVRHEVEVYVEGASGRGDDRAASFGHGAVLGLVVADGAGGGGAGASRAAERLIARVERDWSQLGDAAACAVLLADLDREIVMDPRAAEATGIVAVLADGVLMGASVGDCAAWLVTPSGLEDLAEGQLAQPRLGSGEIVPTVFEAAVGSATVVLASDGLWKYSPIEAIVRAAADHRLDRAVRRLVDAARLRSGRLIDDVGLVLARDRARWGMGRRGCGPPSGARS